MGLSTAVGSSYAWLTGTGRRQALRFGVLEVRGVPLRRVFQTAASAPQGAAADRAAAAVKAGGTLRSIDVGEGTKARREGGYASVDGQTPPRRDPSLCNHVQYTRTHPPVDIDEALHKFSSVLSLSIWW